MYSLNFSVLKGSGDSSSIFFYSLWLNHINSRVWDKNVFIFSGFCLISALDGRAVLFIPLYIPLIPFPIEEVGVVLEQSSFLSTIKPTDNLTDLSRGGLVLSVVLGLLRRRHLKEVPTHYLT